MVKNFDDTVVRFDKESTNVTRHTDGQTSHDGIGRAYAASPRDKNFPPYGLKVMLSTRN